MCVHCGLNYLTEVQYKSVFMTLLCSIFNLVYSSDEFPEEPATVYGTEFTFPHPETDLTGRDTFSSEGTAKLLFKIFIV
jgi:hypothetical protein